MTDDLLRIVMTVDDGSSLVGCHSKCKHSTHRHLERIVWESR